MPDIRIPFEHHQSAHCETGVISNLMGFHGLQVSEPMAFGIGSGLFFSFFPFIKINGIPIASYRNMPGDIFKKFSKRTGISFERHSYRSPESAMRELDETLARGLPVGMLTSVFYLPYLPKAFRFHFNAHNIVIYGKEGNDYLVSDPVMEEPTIIAPNALVRARFAKGMPNTNGRMYFPPRCQREWICAKRPSRELLRRPRIWEPSLCRCSEAGPSTIWLSTCANGPRSRATARASSTWVKWCGCRKK
jgi:hypothetical protein